MISSTKKSKTQVAAISQDQLNRSIAWGPSRPRANHDKPKPSESVQNQAHPAPAEAVDPPSLAALSPQEQALRRQIQDLTRQAEQETVALRYPKALKTYQRLLDLLAQQGQYLPLPEHLRLQGLTQLNTGWLHQQQSHWPAALQDYNLAIQTLQPLAAIQPQSLATSLMIAHRQRSQVYRALEQPESARQDLEASLQFQLQVMNQQADYEDLAQDWLNLATLQQEIEKDEAALSSLDQAEQALKQLNTAESAEVQQRLFLPLLAQRAQLQVKMGALKAAQHSYSELMAQASRQQQPQTWARYALLQAALLFSMQDPEASARLDEIHATVSELEQNQQDTQQLVEPLLSLADLCREQHLSAQALAFYTDGIRCLERSAQGKTPLGQETLMAAYTGRANLLLEQGETSKALTSFRQAMRLASQVADPASRANLEIQLGLCYQSSDRPQQALACFDKALQQLATQPQQLPLEPDSPQVQALYLRAFLQVLAFENIQAALADFTQVEALCPGLAAYDLACLWVRLNQTDKAFEALTQHLASAYALPQAEITADPDLSSLHADPRWAALWN